MSDHTHAVLDRQGNRANVTFRTEAGLNVASVEMMAELENVVDELAADSDVRFVLFRAEGKAFLAGANIKAMASYDAGEGRAMAELGHRVFNKIEALPQVTLVAIQGAALGGGCELAMACDFRFAVKSINIGQPEVLLGLIPGWGGTQRLPRLIGLHHAIENICTGSNISAKKAVQLGLAFDAVPKRVEIYHALRSGPAYRNDLDLIVATPDEQVGAFCIGWLDPDNRVGLLEPVGCHPDHRRRGLARTVVHAALRSLRDAGAESAIVCPNSTNPAACTLYESCGFATAADDYDWVVSLGGTSRF